MDVLGGVLVLNLEFWFRHPKYHFQYPPNRPKWVILDPGKVIFGHFIDFGHFSIEIPIEAKKFYGKWKEESYIKNKNSFEISKQNGTTCRYVQVKKRKNLE